METAGTPEDHSNIVMATKMEVQAPDRAPSPDQQLLKPAVTQPRRRLLGRRSQKGKRRGVAEKRRGLSEKRRGQKQKRRGQEEKKEGVTVKRIWSGGKRRWDKKHYCVFCRRPQVKIARHLLRKHADEQEVTAASALPTGSKERHLLLEHLRCRGNYLHNIEVIRQGSGEIVPWRQPSEEVDARNYLPCPLCLGFFLRADLWKHQVCCRKKLSADPSHHPASKKEPAHATYDPAGEAACDPAADRATKETPADPAGDTTRPCSVDQNQTSDSTVYRTRKRIRVQAAASRLLPISSGASESCSEILHRMNQDNVSYEVKSDWLICKYGNKLMGNQDNSQRRYDYVSQKLRELGRLLLAAKSLDSDIQTLHDLLAPGRLSFALSAARKAAGYRWSRPPMALKTTLKTICEIAMAESLQQGDWEAAAKTTDFYHLLGRQWDNLGLQNPDPDPETAAPDGGPQLKKQLVQSGNEKNPVPDVLSKDGDRQLSSLAEFPPPESRLQTPVPVPMGPRKVRRRPWSTAEKEAIWRQLGVHVLVQSVPGKEVCQRCLDLEPVLRGRHWKDIKNQIHNQIQSQKKQQFHAQMDLEENQELQDQIHNQRKQQLCQAPMDQQKKDLMVEQDQDNPQNQKRPQYLLQINHQAHNSIQNQKKQDDHSQLDHQHHLNIHKKQLCHARPDGQDQGQDHKKQLYQMDQQTQPLHALDQDSSILAASLYGPDGPLRGPGHVLLEREPGITPYPLLPRGSGPQMAQLLTRTEWTEDALVQNYPVNRQLGQNLLLDVLPRGPPPDPHSGHVHF